MKRSKFSLSHYKLLTCKMGQLVPVTWYEALPGDTIQQSTSALVRCSPLVAPVMHPVSIRFHTFFVPNRLIWTNWQDFITGGPDGLNASIAPYVTYASGAGPAVSSLGDYLGIPQQATINAWKYSALPYRAYCTIWNEFYRDEDLETKIPVSLLDGNDVSSYTLQNCDWEKDYLTTARPWAVKGATVTLPAPTNAPTVLFEDGATPGVRTLQRAAAGAGTAANITQAGTAGAVLRGLLDAGNYVGPDINSVRHAFALQRFEEARARYGSRYVEYLRYLGVRSSDARLQRPEYLGGGKNTIQFSEVLQTAPTTSGTPNTGIGAFGGHGLSGVRSNRFRRFFEEHGIVMTLMSVRPKTIYMERAKRAWFRGVDSTFKGMTGTKEDYWQRELQSIGQQAVNGHEVSANWADDSQVFGYQDRYDEYRREESGVAGLFRTTLHTWHLGREFAVAPTLNATFVSSVPSTRVFQDTANDNLYVCCNHNIQARRLVKKEGTSLTF